jgi:hypothetical protein
MVREGEYRDVKAAAMQVAQTLGVTKAIRGSFRADHDTLHIEAHLVDMLTGEQEASETVEAVVSYTRRDRFVDGETSEPTKVDIPSDEEAGADRRGVEARERRARANSAATVRKRNEVAWKTTPPRSSVSR